MKASIRVTQDVQGAIQVSLLTRDLIEPHMIFADTNTALKIIYGVYNDDSFAYTIHTNIRTISGDIEKVYDAGLLFELQSNEERENSISIMLERDRQSRIIVEMEQLYNNQSIGKKSIEFIVTPSLTFTFAIIPRNAKSLVILDAINLFGRLDASGRLIYETNSLRPIVEAFAFLVNASLLDFGIIDVSREKKQLWIFLDREVTASTVEDALHSNINIEVENAQSFPVFVAVIAAIASIIGILIIWFAIESVKANVIISEAKTRLAENIASITSNTEASIEEINKAVEQGVLSREEGNLAITKLLDANTKSLYSLSVTPKETKSFFDEVKDLVIISSAVIIGGLIVYELVKKI
ncbi:MAG: hypothetical protein QXO37_06850 [Candidatus Nitrosocaldaceae archaeon]